MRGSGVWAEPRVEAIPPSSLISGGVTVRTADVLCEGFPFPVEHLGVEMLPFAFALVCLRALPNAHSLWEGLWQFGYLYCLLISFSCSVCGLSDWQEWILQGLCPSQIVLIPCYYPWAWPPRVVLGRISQLLYKVVHKYPLPVRCCYPLSLDVAVVWRVLS